RTLNTFEKRMLLQISIALSVARSKLSAWVARSAVLIAPALIPPMMSKGTGSFLNGRLAARVFSIPAWKAPRAPPPARKRADFSRGHEARCEARLRIGLGSLFAAVIFVELYRASILSIIIDGAAGVVAKSKRLTYLMPN